MVSSVGLLGGGDTGGGQFFANFARGYDGVGVNADGVSHAAGVPAGKGGCDGNVAAASGEEDAFVASFEAGLTEAQAAKLVFFVRIGSPNVKKNFRTKVIEYTSYGGEQGGQVFFIFDAVLERQIEIGGWFVSGIVIFLMNGQRENGGIVAENVRGAVAVVDIGIHDDGFFDGVIGLQAADGYGDVMDRTEALAVVGVGVVEAATQIAGEAVAESELAGENGAARREPDGFSKFRRVRNFKLHDFAGCQVTVLEFADPCGRVDAKEIFV